MKRLVLLSIIGSVIASGSANGQFGVSSPGGTTRKFAAARGALGSSYDKAITIEARDETSGVKSEYAYMQRHFPNCKPINHVREYYHKKTYDIIIFTGPDGKKGAVYFKYLTHY